MLDKKNIRIGFSIGDLNGIGGELILKIIKERELLKSFTPIIYASAKVINFLIIEILFFAIPVSSLNSLKAL